MYLAVLVGKFVKQDVREWCLNYTTCDKPSFLGTFKGKLEGEYA